MLIKPDKNMKLLASLFKGFRGVYFVGGCTRDTLLNRSPVDYDLCCSKSVFNKVITRLNSNKQVYVVKENKKYGTVGYLYKHIPFSVGSFRTEIYLNKSIYPKVSFTEKLELDLGRRDLSINAIVTNLSWQTKDPFGGINALNSKKVEFIGNPTIKIKEDPTRIFRAIDVKCRLNFNYAPKTKKKIVANAQELDWVSGKIIKKWFEYFYLHSNIEQAFADLFKFNVVLYTIPQLHLIYNYDQNTPYHNFLLHSHTLKTMVKVSKAFYGKENFNVRMWSALLHDIGKPFCQKKNKKGYSNYAGHEVIGSKISKQIVASLGFSGAESEFVIDSVLNHMKKDSWLKKFDDLAKK